MNRRIRLAALAPLVVSSLALGPAALLTGSAEAAAPSLVCSVKKSATAGKYDVSVTGATPGVSVTVTGGTPQNQFASTALADDNGDMTTSGFIPVGRVKAGEEGGTMVNCGTVKQAEQQDAQAQYSAGFQKGMAETRAGCAKKPLAQGFAQVDPNFEKGYNAGAQAALNSKACQGQ
ncbi:hypothetical protein HYE82_18010 [Streptomyces sp. BR123]|uniref:hypothetical protein n=1 Tax=Streptomyces sp. BR123 TaxID=2749828 RepID=UPI0015C47CFC|nr:hypothetical protein [Streptomyces sp. BR123]NXY96246.1 hypothetical protein [Streptomyces sp. BR123]